MPKGKRTKKERVVIATKHNKTIQKLQGRGEAEAAHRNTVSRLSKNCRGKARARPLSTTSSEQVESWEAKKLTDN